MVLNILILDDSEMSRIVNQAALQVAANFLGEELAVFHAASADQAWQLWKDERIDGVMADVYLDGSVTGPDFLREARKSKPRLAAVIITGLTDEQNVMKLWDICPVLPKPSTPWFAKQLALFLREAKLFQMLEAGQGLVPDTHPAGPQ